MNFKTTIVLLGIAIVLGAIWLFAPMKTPDAGVGDARSERPGTFEPTALFDPAPESAEVVRVVIERNAKPRIAFERVAVSDVPDLPADWRMTEPLATSVERFRVDSVVSALTLLKARQRYEPGEAGAVRAADAGLEPPQATVTIETKSGKTYTVEVGKKAAMSTDTYVRMAGKPTIYAVTNDLSQQIGSDPNDYRNKRLLQFAAADAVRIEAYTDGKRLIASRSPGGEWVFDEPVKAFAETQKITTLLNAFANLRVDEFSEDSPSSLGSYGLAEPHLRMSVRTESKKARPQPDDEGTTQPAEPEFETVVSEYEIVVGGFADIKSEKRYIKLGDQPWIATVRASDVERITPKLGELRDTRVTRIDASSVTALRVEKDGAAAEIRYDGQRWQGEGDLDQVDSAAVMDVLEALEDLRAISYLDVGGEGEKHGLNPPRATVSVQLSGAVDPVTLEIGDATPSGQNAYARRVGQAGLIVISEAQASRLAVAPLSLRSRTVFECEPAQIRRIKLRRDQSRYVVEHDGSTWVMLEPAGAPVEPNAVTIVAMDIARLRARRVVARNAGEEGDKFGFDAPAVTVEFAVERPATVGPAESQPVEAAPELAVARTTHKLSIGRKDTVAYCRIDDNPYVFELDETVYQVLVAEMIDSRLFRFEPAEVASVTVQALGGSLELIRDDEKWVYAPDPYVELVQKKAADLVDALSKLRVESYIAWSDGDLAEAGLEQATERLRIRLADEREITLHFEPATREQHPRRAAWVEQQRIFRLQPADCEKMLNGLDFYLKADTPAQSPR